jgi:myo-inositol catabolism protein IolC
MALGYDSSLFVLAFDHRGSFQKKMFGIAGEPNAEESAVIADAKKVIFEGFKKAVTDLGVDRSSAGILVDEQFGADIVREAEKEGFLFAMPVEKSGQDEFDFQYDSDFGRHIEDFNPNFSKVLVRYNPNGDAEMNARQSARLKELSDWLHANDRKFLFELLVPATDDQLASVDGDSDRYDKELRPDLMITSIQELQDAGIEADIWKIEGIDTAEDCGRIAAQVRSGGRDGVVCVVLGRGADDAAVDHWLKQGAGVDGYVGFAIGRTIWWDALKGYLDKTLDRDAAADKIAANYKRFIDVYNG